MERSDLREAFLAKAREKPQYEEQEIPGIGKVFIKRLTAGEKDAYEKATPGSTTSRALTVVHCCFDDRGIRVFQESDVQEIEQIDPAAIDPIVVAALRFNGYTKADQEALLKNSNGQAVSS